MSELVKMLLTPLKELVLRAVIVYLRSADGIANITALGTVTDASGLPKVRFDRDDAASGAGYPRLASYSAPTVGDRVLMLRVGNGWVVLGKVVS